MGDLENSSSEPGKMIPHQREWGENRSGHLWAVVKEMEKNHPVNSQKGRITFGTGDVAKCGRRISQEPCRLPATGTMKSLKPSGK